MKSSLSSTCTPVLFESSYESPYATVHTLGHVFQVRTIGQAGAFVGIADKTHLDEDRRDVEEAGGDAFVGKPFREAVLLETVGRLVGIDYVFEEQPPASAEGAPGKPSLAAVPEAFRAPLRAALLAADLGRLLQLADELAALEPATARLVRELAEEFE